jgi:hypothetical protein
VLLCAAGNMEFETSDRVLPVVEVACFDGSK